MSVMISVSFRVTSDESTLKAYVYTLQTIACSFAVTFFFAFCYFYYFGKENTAFHFLAGDGAGSFETPTNYY